MKASNNGLIQPPKPCRWEQLVIFASPLPAAHPSFFRQAQAYKPALQKGHRGPLRTWEDGACLLKQCSIHRKGAVPHAHKHEVTERDKVWFSALPVHIGPRRERGSSPAGVQGCPPGDSSQQHGTATPDTDTRQPRQLRTPQPARRRRERGQLEQCSVREQWSRAVKEKGGRDRDWGGSGRGSSPFPSPPWCPRSCGDIPAVAPPPPPGFLRPSFIPGCRRRRLKGTAAPRCPATSGAAASWGNSPAAPAACLPAAPTHQHRPALPGAAGRARSPSGGAAAAGGGWRPEQGSSPQSALRSRRRPRRRHPGRRGAAGAIYLRRPPSLNCKRRRPRQRSGRPGRS